MTTVRNKLILVGAITLATIFLLLSCQPQLKETRIAHYTLQHRLTTAQDSGLISQVLDTLLFNAGWKGKKQINRQYQSDLINVFLIDGSLSFVQEDEQLNELIGNCAYAGSNIIFLDVAFLHSFLAKHHVIPDHINAELRDDQECFLFWTIGHELGHLANHHIGSHFEAGSFDTYVKNASLENKYELQADSFFVRCINANQGLRWSVERLMINILNAEIRQKVGEVRTYGVGIIYDYTNQSVVQYAQQKTHPEYVIRLSRMLELSSKMGGDAGLYNLVDGFVKQLKEVK